MRITKAEYARRRKALMSQMEPNSIAIPSTVHLTGAGGLDREKNPRVTYAGGKYTTRPNLLNKQLNMEEMALQGITTREPPLKLTGSNTRYKKLLLT